ncbi:MAG: phosphoribosylformylglycinamidine synthase subunit PurQ [Planctomycetota bacterium]|nr:MAG: phosphoribosylformylglycinamidine synthase subunit PurQ [Planctomycetota bacterium]
MKPPRVLQLFAAGVNCDRELAHAFTRAGAEVVQVHVRELIRRPQLLRDCRLFALPGGFTYGDDLGAGAILGAEVRAFLAEELAAHHDRGGTIFGVCNGFQVLVRCGLLPGLEGVRASLTWNRTHRFECRWVRLRVEPGLGHVLPAGSILPAAAAHAEGRLVLGDPERDLPRLEAAGLVALRYADAAGRPTREWPACPNGSDGAIAGLVSASGRILGLMPHPERNLGPESLPDRGAGAWGDGGEGIAFFRGLLALDRDPAAR